MTTTYVPDAPARRYERGLRTEQPQASRAAREEMRDRLEAWALAPWTDDLDDADLAEPGTARLRRVLNFTGRRLTLLELAALRAQRGISPRV